MFHASLTVLLCVGISGAEGQQQARGGRRVQNRKRGGTAGTDGVQELASTLETFAIADGGAAARYALRALCVPASSSCRLQRNAYGDVYA